MLSRLGRPFIVLACLWLSACGFEPLYGENQDGFSTDELLQFIQVSPIEDRTGQLLRIELSNRLTPTRPIPEPIYALLVTLNESKAGLAVKKDASTTRANLTITAQFQLVEIGSGEVLTQGTVRSVNSYDILLSDFATLAAEADARERGTRDLSDGIVDRISIYLSRAQDAATTGRSG